MRVIKSIRTNNMDSTTPQRKQLATITQSRNKDEPIQFSRKSHTQRPKTSYVTSKANLSPNPRADISGGPSNQVGNYTVYDECLHGMLI